MENVIRFQLIMKKKYNIFFFLERITYSWKRKRNEWATVSLQGTVLKLFRRPFFNPKNNNQLSSLYDTCQAFVKLANDIFDDFSHFIHAAASSDVFSIRKLVYVAFNLCVYSVLFNITVTFTWVWITEAIFFFEQCIVGHTFIVFHKSQSTSLNVHVVSACIFCVNFPCSFFSFIHVIM